MLNSEVSQPVKIRGFMVCGPLYAKQKRAPGTSATQRPQRPLVRTQALRLKSEKISILRGLFLAVGVALGRAGQDLLGDQTGVLADRGLDLGGHVGIGFEERL